jgi:hypothetical protein
LAIEVNKCIKLYGKNCRKLKMTEKILLEMEFRGERVWIAWSVSCVSGHKRLFTG